MYVMFIITGHKRTFRMCVILFTGGGTCTGPPLQVQPPRQQPHVTLNPLPREVNPQGGTPAPWEGTPPTQVPTGN